VIAARPQRVVLALNMRGFNREATRGFAYIESAGWMPPEQLVEALGLRLWDAGLTADRLLLYNGLQALGAEEAWRASRRLQARAFRLYQPAADALDAALGIEAHVQLQKDIRLVRWTHNVVEFEGRPRHTRELVEKIMGPVLSGLSTHHPNLELLARVLGRLRAAHIPVLVYIEPFNIQYIRSLNVSMAGLPRSLRNIRRVVEGQGAELLDLHSILPDAAFRDPGDHYTYEGEPNGTFLVARRLAAQLAGNVPTQQAMNISHVVQ
jgi:hypothetical protein